MLLLNSSSSSSIFIIIIFIIIIRITIYKILIFLRLKQDITELVISQWGQKALVVQKREKKHFWLNRKKLPLLTMA